MEHLKIFVPFLRFLVFLLGCSSWCGMYSTLQLDRTLLRTIHWNPVWSFTTSLPTPSTLQHSLWRKETGTKKNWMAQNFFLSVEPGSNTKNSTKAANYIYIASKMPGSKKRHPDGRQIAYIYGYIQFIFLDTSEWWLQTTGINKSKRRTESVQRQGLLVAILVFTYSCNKYISEVLLSCRTFILPVHKTFLRQTSRQTLLHIYNKERMVVSQCKHVDKNKG